jgi:predicted DCC family thiol-disulfide oxidoreductase YuxK
MPGSTVQGARGIEDVHLVLYDGVCGLCDGLVQFVLEHDRRGVFRFAPLQSATGQAMVQRCGGNPHQLTSFYVFANYRTSAIRVFTKSAATLFVAGELGWPWRVGVLMRVVPAAVLNRVYDAISRTRYPLFGRLERCLAPRPEFQHRFIDS